MNFYSVKDLRVDTKSVFDNVKRNGEAVITNNGKPAVLILDVSEDDLELTLRAIRQAKAMIAFNAMRRTAEAHGFMSEEEINAEIQAARSERRRKE